MDKYPQGVITEKSDKWLMASLRSKETKLANSFKTYSTVMSKNTPGIE